LGSAALDLAYVAAGRLDGYWESRLHPWDVAAGTLLVREAGGRVSNYADEQLPVPYIGLVASNGLLHPEMLTVLREGDSAPRPA
jgi:myo-inositol-1(or 4)-monophosphatase